MKKRLALSPVIILMLAFTSLQEGLALDFDTVFNVMPAAVIMDLGSDRFVLETEGQRIRTPNVYSMPTVSAGVGIDLDKGYVDITGGGGFLFSSSLRALLLMADVGIFWQVNRSLSIGPHLGLLYLIDPTWLEDGDVDIDNSWGLIGGLNINMGEKITYLVSMDFVGIPLDAETAPGGVSSGSLDISGLAIRFGVRGEF